MVDNQSRLKILLLVQNFTKEKAIKELTPYLAQSTMDFVRTLWRNVENAGNLGPDSRQVPKEAQIIFCNFSIFDSSNSFTQKSSHFLICA